MKSLSLFAATALSCIPPSLAEEIAAEEEKVEHFDFNLTLPIMTAQFLILMFALDKIYFTPLGKFMDERDAAIKEKLSSVKDTSEEVKQLEEQVAAVMKVARAEIADALNKMQRLRRRTKWVLWVFSKSQQLGSDEHKFLGLKEPKFMGSNEP